jgi:hypothetical protein
MSKLPLGVLRRVEKSFRPLVLDDTLRQSAEDAGLSAAT